ncbi:hypothetical protein JX266_007275 [Neoarthrinium moseri]|nr:hypothetical protein JX266_007275 [Neoarthrinium moseri]
MDGQDHKSRRKSCIDELAGKIQDAMKRGNDGERAFCCHSSLRAIWKERRLQQLLFDNRLTDSQIDFLWKHLLGFLSFIVWAEIPDDDWFSTFKSRIFSPPDTTCARFIDDHLPLDLETLKGLGFKSHRVEKFWIDQHRFIPAVLDFSIQRDTQKIGPHVRLPFEFRAEEDRRGGYGLIEFYRIPPEYVQSSMYGHATWKPNEPYAVAVKSFKEGRTDAQREIETLCRVKMTLPGDLYRITLHHTIIEQDMQYYIILPLADLGNLDQFLRAQSAVSSKTYSLQPKTFRERFPDLPSHTAELAGALLEQCVAIADALKWLHAGFRENQNLVYLAHMDLKPDNILLFDGHSAPVGFWKLADFGISVIKKIHKGVQERQTMHTGARRPQNTYQAPEVEKSWLSGGSSKVGRKSDIWSFGAIFSEVLTFAEGGPSYLTKFERTRPGTYDNFYCPIDNGLSPGSPDFQVRPNVVTWLEDLCHHAGADRSYVTCWTRCVKRLLIVDPQHRPDAAQLLDYVNHVSDHVHRFIQQEEPPMCIFDQAQREPLPRLRGSDAKPIAPAAPDIQFNLVNTAVDNAEQSASMNAESFVSTGTNSDGLSPRSSRVDSDPEGSSTRHTSMSQPGMRAAGGPIAYSRSTPLLAESTLEIDLPKTELYRESWEPGINTRSCPKDVAIGQLWIAYLSRFKVYMFRLRPDYQGKRIVQPTEGVDLPTGDKNEWRSIVVSGHYLVVWGESKRSREPLFRVYRVFPQDAGGSPPTLLQTSLKDFDSPKRVALSCQGFVAVISSKNLLISQIEAPGETQRLYTAAGIPEDESYFEDIVFNEEGDILYAWAAGRRGWLLCYRIIKPFVIHLEHKTSHDCEINQKLHLAKLLPYDRTMGCILSPDAGKYVAFSAESSITDNISPMLSTSLLWPTVSDIRACCIYGDRSFVIAKPKSLRKTCLVEYPLPRNGAYDHTEERIICRLDSRLIEGSAMKFFRCGNDGAILVVICHRDGKMEVIKYGTKRNQ